MQLPTVEQFRTLCKQHDWTHEFSDDHYDWKKGVAEHEELFAIIKMGGERYLRVYGEEMPDILRGG